MLDRVKTRLFIIFIAILAFAGAARAQDKREPVHVDGRTIFSVGPIGDLDAATRADRVEGRLAALLDNPDAIAPAAVVTTGPNERSITIAGTTIATVTEADAEDNLTTLDALAAEWAAIIDQALSDAIKRRERGGGPVLVLMEGAFAGLLESIKSVLPRFLAALLVLVAFGLLAWLVRRALRWLSPNLRGSDTSKTLFKQLVFYSIWALGIVVAVSALGFDPQALATAIGLTSVALGFALKDVLSNLISGLLLLIMRPFHLGDQIIVGDTEGAVERIELRATRIRTYDGRVVLVPNAELFTSRVTNNTAAPVRRGSVFIRLGYDAELRRAAELVLAATRVTAGVLDEPPPSILLSELEPMVVAIEVRFWTDSRRGDFVATRSRVNEAVVDALKRGGVPLPDPAVIRLVTE